MSVRNRRGRTRSIRRTSASNKSNNLTADDYARQHNLIGAISQSLLVVPVRILGESTTYEISEITRWLNEKGTSPMTRAQKSVNDLVPANDIQQKIRTFVRQYPDEPIVREWLQEQPAWYTRAIQRIRDAPPVAAMTRTFDGIKQNPRAAECAQCCRKTAEGAATGAAIGTCMGCTCAARAVLLDKEDKMPIEGKRIFLNNVGAAGACVGGLTGACLGREKCLKLGKNMCMEGIKGEMSYQGVKTGLHALGELINGGKRKRRKTKRRKTRRRKTRRRKNRGKKTRRRKRKTRGRKTRKR